MVDKMWHIVLRYDQRNKVLDSSMLNQDSYIYKFDQGCIHNYHLDMFQRKYQLLLKYPHSKTI